MEKSEVLPIGNTNAHDIPVNLPIKVNNTGLIQILGIYIGDNSSLCSQMNWDSKIDKCLTVLNIWRTRSLTLKGKILIVNSLIVSRIVYVLNLTNLPSWVVPKLKKAIVDFIWDGKRHRIRYKVLISSISDGGLGMIDIDRMKKPLRCKYIRKTFDDEHPLNPVTRELICYNLSKYGDFGLGSDVFRSRLSNNRINLLPPYYSELLYAFKHFVGDDFVKPMNDFELKSQPICHNPFIIDKSGESLDYVDFCSENVCRIQDIIYEFVPGFLSSDAIVQLIDSNSNSETKIRSVYANILSCIPDRWKTRINSVALADSRASPSLHFRHKITEAIIDIRTIDTRFVNHYFRQIDSIDLIPAGLDYWRDQFGDNNLIIPFHSCYGGLKQNFRAQIDYFLVHNALYTNSMLHIMKVSDDPICTFCSVEDELPFHLFIECNYIQVLFNLVWDLCQTIIGKPIAINFLIKYFLFGYPNKKNKGEYKLMNFVCNLYRSSIWVCRNCRKRGENVNLICTFKRLVKNRLDLEYQCHSRFNDPSAADFFKIFGIGEALVFPTADGYELAFN